MCVWHLYSTMRLCFTCIPGKSAWELKKTQGHHQHHTAAALSSSVHMPYGHVFTQSCHSLIMLSTRTAFSPSCLRPVANNHRTWIGHLGQGKQTVSLIQFRGFRSLFSICYHSSPSIPPPLLPNITKPFLLEFLSHAMRINHKTDPMNLCKMQGVHRKKHHSWR